MTKQRPTLKKSQVAALGGVLVVLAIIITVGTITEKANEQAAPTATPTEALVASEPATQATETPESGQILTVDNNEDFAALLTGPEHGDAVEAFAAKYQGRTIEFDGNIAAMSNDGDDDTRYYFLILAGNHGGLPMTGPNFQFRDVSVLDLHLSGSNIPASVGVGDNLHIIAELDGYNDVQGLFFLDPVSTEIR